MPIGPVALNESVGSVPLQIVFALLVDDRGTVASTALPLPSSMRFAVIAFGVGRGSASANSPEFTEARFSIDTRARAVTYGGLKKGKNDGRLVSLSLTSIAASVQGDPLSSLSFGC